MQNNEPTKFQRVIIKLRHLSKKQNSGDVKLILRRWTTARASGSFSPTTRPKSAATTYNFDPNFPENNNIEKPTAHNEHRHAKSAPSTPEADRRLLTRNAESETRLVLAAAQERQARPKSKGSDVSTTSQKSPTKEMSPKIHRGRKSKFHKRFPNIPRDEHVLNTYSCAYFGDILLQGYLYISPNWICFYTKILGHAKQIQIPIQEVINISKEKTAFIFPNAIGVRTRKAKWLFGSLMTRDSTYKLMLKVWKQATGFEQLESPLSADLDSSNGIQQSVELETSIENNNSYEAKELLPGVSPGSMCYESTDLDSEMDICKECGSSAGLCDNCCEDDLLDSQNNVDIPTTHKNTISVNPRLEDSETPSTTAWHRLLHHLRTSLDFRKTIEKLGSTQSSTLRMSGSSFLLLLCTILAVFLVISAVIMTYKILWLQAQLDSSGDADMTSIGTEERMYQNLYFLNNQYHAATVEKFHSVIQANIQLLAEVHQSLKILHGTAKDISCTMDGNKEGMAGPHDEI